MLAVSKFASELAHKLLQNVRGFLHDIHLARWITPDSGEEVATRMRESEECSPSGRRQGSVQETTKGQDAAPSARQAG